MDSGKTFDMLHCETLHEKRTSIGLNVSAAMSVKKTPNTLLKKTPQKPNKTQTNKLLSTPTQNQTKTSEQNPLTNKQQKAPKPPKQNIPAKRPENKINRTKQNKNDDEKKIHSKPPEDASWKLRNKTECSAKLNGGRFTPIFILMAAGDVWIGMVGKP